MAVIYADHQQARSPAARPLVAKAIKLGCRAVLVDTFDKQAGGLVEHWPIEQIEWLVGTAPRGGHVGRTGRPADDAGDSRFVADYEADFIAVRGAACAAHRAGTISAERLAELVALLVGRRPAPARSRVPASGGCEEVGASTQPDVAPPCPAPLASLSSSDGNRQMRRRAERG